MQPPAIESENKEEPFVQSKIIGTSPNSTNGEPDYIGDSVGTPTDCPKEEEDDMTQSPRVRKHKDGTYEVIHLDEEGEPILTHDGQYTCIQLLSPMKCKVEPFSKRRRMAQLPHSGYWKR